MGYFLKPEELFGEVAKRGNGDSTQGDLFSNAAQGNDTNFILEDLQKILTNIQLEYDGN
ncbi:MAG: hypothetical protein U5N85_17800 [Arcicella sp.]|nr:hypothetical protein [Arcicella sp.]